MEPRKNLKNFNKETDKKVITEADNYNYQNNNYEFNDEFIEKHLKESNIVPSNESLLNGIDNLTARVNNLTARVKMLKQVMNNSPVLLMDVCISLHNLRSALHLKT